MSGWKQISNQNSTIVQSNGQFVKVLIYDKHTANAWATIGGTVPAGYRPSSDMAAFTTVQSSSTNKIYLTTNGTITTASSLSNTQVYANFIYPII